MPLLEYPHDNEYGILSSFFTDINDIPVTRGIIFAEMRYPRRSCLEITVIHILDWYFQPCHNDKGQGESVRNNN